MCIILLYIYVGIERQGVSASAPAPATGYAPAYISIIIDRYFSWCTGTAVCGAHMYHSMVHMYRYKGTRGRCWRASASNGIHTGTYSIIIDR